MQLLILLLALIAIILIVRAYTPKPVAGAKPIQGGNLPDAQHSDVTELKKIVSDARGFFSAAKRETHAAEHRLIAAYNDLSEQTDILSQRIEADTSQSSNLRQPVLRLLLPLNGVARRAAKASHRPPTAERDSLLEASAAALHRAAAEMKRISGIADEAALRQLEIDLEVLEERLGKE